MRSLNSCIFRLKEMRIGIEGPIDSLILRARPSCCRYARLMYIVCQGGTVVGYDSTHPRGRSIHRSDQAASDIDAIHSAFPESRIWWR